MFLVPIGHDRAEVHRFPLVTVLLLGSCTLVAALSWPQLDARQAEQDAALHEVEVFLEEHPFLQPNAAHSGTLAGACARRVAALERGDVSFWPGREPQSQQKLDEHC